MERDEHLARAVCDAISIGLGFDASAVQLAPIADKQPPQPDRCN
jgi:hypothetical protein